MAATDLDVIKDIPGYKAILKAVLKSQIQKLVEQLAAHTDEESVILTASVADGSLSHLGSDSGKGFLEDHEDVKSQFLGFCLKRHHKKQQEMEELKRQTLLESIQQMPVPAQLGYGPAPRRISQTSYPRPSTLPRAPPGVGIRFPGIRHEPYNVSGRPRKTSSNTAIGSMPTTPVKQEPSDTSNDGVSESDNVNQSPSQSALSRDEDVSNSSSSTIPNDPSELGASTTSETGAPHHDNDQKVKLEAISEAEMELEITGVEPGRPVLSQDWDPNVSMGMNFDPNSGATGTAGDMQQGYKNNQSKQRERRDGSGIVDPKNVGAHVSCRMPGKSTTCKFHTRVLKQRKETVYGCLMCNVHLCKDGCHYRYHTKYQPYRDSLQRLRMPKEENNA